MFFLIKTWKKVWIFPPVPAQLKTKISGFNYKWEVLDSPDHAGSVQSSSLTKANHAGPIQGGPYIPKLFKSCFESVTYL